MLSLRRRHSISRSITLTVMAGLLIPAVLGGIRMISKQHSDLTQELITQQRQGVELLAIGLENPLWNINRDSVISLIHALLIDPRITRITVSDRNLGKFAEELRPERRKGEVSVLEQPILHGGSEIGTVSVEMDDGNLHSQLNRATWILFATVTLQVLLSMGLIITLLKRRLLLPIRRLVRESGKLALQELDSPFVWKQEDELGALGRALDGARLALKGLFSKQRQMNFEILDALRKREEFMTIAAHEFRTPLMPLICNLQFIAKQMKQTENPQLLSSLDIAITQTRRLTTLIEDTLGDAIAGQATFNLTLSSVDLAELVQNTVSHFKPKFDRAACPLTLSLSQGVVGQWDPGKIERVLGHLIENALKYGRGQEIRISVEAKGNLARLKIQDLGIGIDPKDHLRIFERLERATSVHHYGGFGLGLHITKEIVRAHGGIVHVESALGKGAAFIVELPMNREHLP